jgi:regulator of sigma E protease
MSALATIFWLIVTIVVFVLVHEAGHFIAARAFGVRVTEFMIGLPGPNIGFERNGCRYGITCIPLGGYNRITGMEGGPEDPNLASVLAYVCRQGKTDVEHAALACGISEEDAEYALTVLDGWGSIKAAGRNDQKGTYAAVAGNGFELGQPREVSDPQTLLDEERSHTYRGLSCAKRLVVLFAGPVMNLLLALILFLVIFCGIGLTVSSTTISSVSDGGPAQAAGLQAGDTITQIDDAETPDWKSLSQAISEHAPGDTISVGYVRDGVSSQTVLTASKNENGAAYFGIYSGQTQYRLSVGEAMATSWEYCALTIRAYANLFNPTTAADTISQSTSIVGIAVITERAASAGLVPLLYILAVVSLSLGIVNLVPLPPLDGGRIVVELIQRVARREIPVKVVNAITIVVIVLLMLLFFVLLRQDIVNFILGG